MQSARRADSKDGKRRKRPLDIILHTIMIVNTFEAMRGCIVMIQVGREPMEYGVFPVITG